MTHDLMNSYPSLINLYKGRIYSCVMALRCDIILDNVKTWIQLNKESQEIQKIYHFGLPYCTLLALLAL